jgi:hypothetical protein
LQFFIAVFKLDKDMYDQIRGDILFTILYSAVATMALLTGCYLLFSKANAFATDITPPEMRNGIPSTSNINIKLWILTK